MPLEKSTQRFLQIENSLISEIDFFSDLDLYRSKLLDFQRHWDVPQVDVFKEEDRIVNGPNGEIPIRLYWPAESSSQKGLPIYVTYHGGGWILGDLDVNDNLCRYMCKYSKSIVVSVDYRLAPEHKFPAGVEDSFAALQWAAKNAESIGGDPAKIIVGGESAGGNIAAVMCHLARDLPDLNVWKQLLVYPSLDISTDGHYESRKKYGTDEYTLPEESLKLYRKMYADEKYYSDYRLSPMRAKEFQGLPEALIILPEYDPLLDEGIAYAGLLKNAGVAASCKIYKGVLHGFTLQSGIVGVGLEALNDAAAFVRDELQSTA